METGGFDFYQLGKLQFLPDEPVRSPLDWSEHGWLAAYSLHGEYHGVVCIEFDAGMDRSMGTEMGNILSSRIADQISKSRNDAWVLTSPVFTPSLERFQGLIESSPTVVHQTYVYRPYSNPKNEYKIQLWMIGIQPLDQELAHA